MLGVVGDAFVSWERFGRLSLRYVFGLVFGSGCMWRYLSTCVWGDLWKLWD